MQPHQRYFIIACATEASLAGVALVLNWLFGRALQADLHWSATAALAGFLAVVPPLAFFIWSTESDLAALRGIRNVLERIVRPIFSRWSLWQLLTISVLAGVGEEMLFRGAIQGILAGWVGPVPALVLASILFGAFHPMTRGYTVVTTVIGLYLGTLWLVTGNLLAPIITHAFYDFGALIYFLRFEDES